jgi:hypothetical protein
MPRHSYIVTGRRVADQEGQKGLQKGPRNWRNDLLTVSVVVGIRWQSYQASVDGKRPEFD